MKLKSSLLFTLTFALASFGLAQDKSPAAATTTTPTTSAPAPEANTPVPQTSAPAAQTNAPAPAASAPDVSAPASSGAEDKGSTAPETPAREEQKSAAAQKQEKAEKDEFDFPHDGKTDDISAIGNRNVGCNKGLGNWYSLEGQVRMGKSFAMQVEQSAKVINDPVVSEYVNRIAQNIVRNSDAKVPFTVKVLDDDQVNAFALPGGYFYVQSGLILAADNEAELAGVMAHEIGHVAACHAARQQTRGNLAQIASIPLIFIGGGLGYGLYEAAGPTAMLTFMKFQRNFEAQADYLGVQYLYASGYDPQAFPQFFEKIQALEKKKPGFVAKAFETHPPTPARMEHTQHEIATILPSKPQYVVNTSEFDEVKSRLAKLENRRKVDQGKDKAPSLRRANTSSGDSTSQNPDDQTKTADDRPTLKRRD